MAKQPQGPTAPGARQSQISAPLKDIANERKY